MRIFTEFLKRAGATLLQHSVSGASLAAIAEDLSSPPADFPPAGPCQELVYGLAEESRYGLALYLVSDAPGLASPPHEHLTWAVITGAGGVEVTTLYRIIDPKRREVAVCREIVVGAGQTLVLSEGAIHSTAVLGATAMYHLHLYGKPLRSLPPLRERTYALARMS